MALSLHEDELLVATGDAAKLLAREAIAGRASSKRPPAMSSTTAS
jgi:hypothetical protein